MLQSAVWLSAGIGGPSSRPSVGLFAKMLCYCVVCPYKYNTEIYLARDNGETHQELSKTQAHEVVVPWQHQAVSEEEASTGTNEEPVAIDVGEHTGTVLLCWLSNEGGRERYKPKPMALTCIVITVARNRVLRANVSGRTRLLSDGTGGVRRIGHDEKTNASVLRAA